MRHIYRMPKDERPIMLVGSKLTVTRCPACNNPVLLRTGMPATPADCDVCNPFKTTLDDTEIKVECAGTLAWHRTLPDGQRAHVSTYPEYLPPRRA